jgi:hypothetical protein
MNEQLIDTVITEGPKKQVAKLAEILKTLDIQFASSIKSANALNTELSNVKNFSELGKSVTKTALELEKLQAAQNKTAITASQLESVNKKIAADEQARAEKALAQLVKKQAAQEAANAKEIANAEAKAAKLAAIQAEADRKAGVQFPTAQTSPNQSTVEPDVAATRYEPIITGQENMAIAATKTTEAIAIENAALLEQQEVLAGLSVEYRANLELLLALKAEQAANTAELKALTIADAASGERAVFLTAEQIKLKTAIQQTNLTLSQQTKQLLAENTSAAQMQARLDELRVAYNNLSLAEKENVAIGGVWLAEIKQLDTAVKANAATQGVHNKEVGNYSGALQKAGNGLTSMFGQLRQLAYILPGIGVAGLFNLAFEAISKAAAALGLFNSKITLAESNLANLNEVSKNASKQYGEQATNLKILYQAAIDVNNSEHDRMLAVRELQKEFPDYFKNLSSENILNGDASVIYKELTVDILENAKAKAAATKIAELSAKQLDVEFTKQKIFNALASKNARVKPLTNANIGTGNDASLRGGDFFDAKKQAQSIADQKYVNGQRAAESLREQDQNKKDLQAQIDFLTNYAGGNNKIAQALSTKNTPTMPKTRDTANTDLLESNRIDIEAAKKRNKAIFDDDKYSYEARLVALDQYVKKSKELLDNSAEIVKADTNMRTQQRLNALKKLKNDEADIAIEAVNEREKLDKQELEKHKRHLADMLTASKESEQEQLETLNRGAKQALLALTENRDDRINALSLERAKGKITEQKYNEDLLQINDRYNIDRIAQEISVQRAILAIKTTKKDKDVISAVFNGADTAEVSKISSADNKDINSTADEISRLELELKNAKNKLTVDTTKGGGKDADKRQKDEIFALQETGKAIDEIENLRQKAFEAEISRLEKLKEQVDENANNEKLRINDSIASNATKARQIAVIDAQSASAKKALDVQEAKIKEKAAIADKEAAIAKIILNTSIAAIKAPAELGPILGLAAVPIVLALGAVELALAVATPIPKYARGTENYPGGLGIWGEAGMERADLPDGTVHYSSGPSLANFPKGTKITPHIELMQQIRPARVEYVGGEAIGWAEVVKAIKDNKQERARMRVVVNVDAGYEAYKRGYLSR